MRKIQLKETIQQHLYILNVLTSIYFRHVCQILRKWEDIFFLEEADFLFNPLIILKLEVCEGSNGTIYVLQYKMNITDKYSSYSTLSYPWLDYLAHPRKEDIFSSLQGFSHTTFILHKRVLTHDFIPTISLLDTMVYFYVKQIILKFSSRHVPNYIQ